VQLVAFVSFTLSVLATGVMIGIFLERRFGG
jgi:hypothetical protein